MNPIEGKVVAVCTSPKHGFPTIPQDFVFIDELGIPGDAHSGQWRTSFTVPGTYKANDRPISIVSYEMMQAVNNEFNLNIEPGGFNEQIVVEGLGDLGWIAIGTMITFEGNSIQLKIVDYAYPCTTLTEFHKCPGLLDFLVDTSRRNSNGKNYSKRGILAEVKQTGTLVPGQTMKVGSSK